MISHAWLSWIIFHETVSFKIISFLSCCATDSSDFLTTDMPYCLFAYTCWHISNDLCGRLHLVWRSKLCSCPANRGYRYRWFIFLVGLLFDFISPLMNALTVLIEITVWSILAQDFAKHISIARRVDVTKRVVPGHLKARLSIFFELVLKDLVEIF